MRCRRVAHLDGEILGGLQDRRQGIGVVVDIVRTNTQFVAAHHVSYVIDDDAQPVHLLDDFLAQLGNTLVGAVIIRHTAIGVGRVDVVRENHLPQAQVVVFLEVRLDLRRVRTQRRHALEVVDDAELAVPLRPLHVIYRANLDVSIRAFRPVGIDVLHPGHNDIGRVLGRAV